jgi:ATP-dependent Clp protease ATP-binding subunit ClpA
MLCKLWETRMNAASDTLFSGRLHRYLSERITGQEDAIRDVVHALVPRLFQNLLRENTSGVFLFVGPPGTGKGRMAESLGEFLLGDADRLLRLNCSLFQEGCHSLNLLDRSRLGHPVQPSDFRIVLLESIEMSTPALLDLWTHIFAHGKVGQDGGPPISFHRTLFLLKSAVGQREIDRPQTEREVGFARDGDPGSREADALGTINRSIEERFPPRFLYHLTRVIHFRPLAANHLDDITDRLMEECRQHFQDQRIDVVLDDPVRAHLREIGSSRGRWSAKGVRQVIVENLFYPISDLILSGRVAGPSRIWVQKGDEGLVFCITGSAELAFGMRPTGWSPPGHAEPLVRVEI